MVHFSPRKISWAAAVVFLLTVLWMGTRNHELNGNGEGLHSYVFTNRRSLSYTPMNTTNRQELSPPSNKSQNLEETQPITKKGKVILSSYMRSGSTFTGDIFQFSPDVFYNYEPLLYTRDEDIVVPRNKPVRARLETNFYHIPNPPEVLDYTMDMLTCKLTDHNLRFLLGLRFTNSLTEFQDCKSHLPLKADGYGECGKNVRERCEKSSTVVSKILRLKMWEIEELLKRDFDLKVIHLVRDPRGVAFSRRDVSYYFNPTTYCSRFNDDSRMSATLQVKYPGRILTVRYEDLARHPVAISRRMFEFSGIPWSKDIHVRLLNITSPKDNQFKERVFSTRRKNSTWTAFSWRHKLDFATAQRIQELCKVAMFSYGYVAFTNESELRNLNFTSLEHVYSNNYNKAQAL